MTYTMTYVSGADLISTVDSGSGTDILIGDVTSTTAGSVTGPVIDDTKVGTSAYTVTGTLTGSINGVAIPANAVLTESVTIHVVKFTITITYMLYWVLVP